MIQLEGNIFSVNINNLYILNKISVITQTIKLALFFRLSLGNTRSANKIKKPKFEIKKWQLQIIRIFEFIFTTLFFRKRMLTKATINALYNIETHNTNKIKKAIDFEFLDMKVYLKTLVGKM